MDNKSVKYSILNLKKKNKLKKLNNFSLALLKKHRYKSSNTIFMYLYCFIGILFLTIILPKSIDAYSKNSPRNEFYNNIINFNIPCIENLNKDKQNGTNNILNHILNFVGFNSKNPISIMEKEVSYFKSVGKDEETIDYEETNELQEEDTSVDPFKLDEKYVEKDATKDAIIENKSIVTGEEFKNSKYKSKTRSLKPQVLIYHTHTHEAYLPSGNRSTDNNYNVCAVGDTLKQSLEKNFNINVIHDTTIHDTNYTKCYYKSGETLDKYLKAYGDFDLIIDLHRDDLSTKNGFLCKINGDSVAKFLFVLTSGNPHYLKNKAVTDKIVSISNSIYPGIVRGNGYYEKYKRGINYYSQDKSNNAFTIEVGGYSNDISEVKNTGKYLSRIIAEYLNGKNE